MVGNKILLTKKVMMDSSSVSTSAGGRSTRSRAPANTASAASALQQQLARDSGRGGISRELSKLVNKKTPTMSKEQVLRRVRRRTQNRTSSGGQEDADGEDQEDDAGEEEEDEEVIEGLTLYESNRDPIALHDDPNHTTTLQVRTLNVELTCPICLGIMRHTMTVMECLHRFCDECISKCLRWGKKECPTCRVHCSSRRHLRPDPNFDRLIATVYPNLDEYEAQEEEFIADINKQLNRKSLTESVERGIMRQQKAASRRARREKTEAEGAAPIGSPQSVSPSSTSSSSSRKRKPAESKATSSSSNMSPPASNSRQSGQGKRSKRQKSIEAEESARPLELDAAGIPLAHYHIPPRKHAATTAASPAVTAFLNQAETLISFLLQPHPSDDSLRPADGAGLPSSPNSSVATTAGLVLQRPYLRTARSVKVKHIMEFLASKFPQVNEKGFIPSSLDFIVPIPSNPTSSADEEGGGEGKEKERRQNLFRISIVPSKPIATEKEETDSSAAGDKMEQEQHGASPEGYVDLDEELTIDDVATRYWDGSGDLTLFYKLVPPSS